MVKWNTEDKCVTLPVFVESNFCTVGGNLPLILTQSYFFTQQ